MGRLHRKARHHLRIPVVPGYGKPKLLQLDDASSIAVGITTEAEVGRTGKDGEPTHDVYFNRGVAGSQAYARKFPGKKPDETVPDSDQMKWLSRGLFEALTGFIRRAAGKDAKSYKLRAMLYEFRYLPVGEAFRDAWKAGADVSIRYEAKAENEAMIAQARIKGIWKPQKSRAAIRHNKFIVLIHKEKPVAVWTGSTNISPGGIFGHSNVGHAIWDEAIAQRYLEYLGAPRRARCLSQTARGSEPRSGAYAQAHIRAAVRPHPNALQSARRKRHARDAPLVRRRDDLGEADPLHDFRLQSRRHL